MSSASARKLGEYLFRGKLTAREDANLEEVVSRNVTPGLKPLQDGRSFCKNTELVRKMAGCCSKL